MKQCNSMEGTQLGTRWVCVENGLFSFITTIAMKQNVIQGKELYKHEIDSGQGAFVWKIDCLHAFVWKIDCLHSLQLLPGSRM